MRRMRYIVELCVTNNTRCINRSNIIFVVPFVVVEKNLFDPLDTANIESKWIHRIQHNSPVNWTASFCSFEFCYGDILGYPKNK